MRTPMTVADRTVRLGLRWALSPEEIEAVTDLLERQPSLNMYERAALGKLRDGR